MEKVLMIKTTSFILLGDDSNTLWVRFSSAFATKDNMPYYREHIEKDYLVTNSAKLLHPDKIQTIIDQGATNKFIKYCKEVLKQHGLECDALKDEEADVLTLKK